MHLRNDERFFKNFTIQHLNIDIPHSLALQRWFWQCKKYGGLQCLNLLVAGFLLEQTLDTHEYGIFRCHILREFLSVLVVELADQSLGDPIDAGTHLAFAQYKLTFGEFHRNKNALQHVQLVVSHGAVASGQFAGHVACCQSDCCHYSI